MSLTVAEALRHTSAQLQKGQIPDPATDARRLVAWVVDCDAAALTLKANTQMSAAQRQKLDRATAARLAHQPIAQIIGTRAFWTSTFMVTRDVLDPRPETEGLVATALEHPFTKVLDLGTGTGCILLSLLKERGNANGLGVDVSPAAIDVAERNGRALDVSDRVEWRVSDWWGSVSETFDLIVSNPPYVTDDEYQTLSADVRDWEPSQALTPGDDGLDAYRQIAGSIGKHLTAGGYAVFEIGSTQAAAVVAIFGAVGFYDARIVNDLDGRDRIVWFKNT